MQNISEINALIKLISKLPGLGPKSAKRIILKLISNRQELMKPLAQTLMEAYKNVARCKNCGSLKSSNSNCDNCQNNSKQYSKICVVENIADQWTIETSSVFKGYFHILGGTLSNSNSQGKENLLLDSLIERIKQNNIDEVILGTSATVEGQTTAFYIQDKLRNMNIKVSKLAQGLPVGGEIESLDDGTLISAFKYRKGLNSESD
ncbi:MAG: recombination mediator RecR [Candidatus Pelagibacter sp.]|tara:strand:+ start:900 stop:1514 length:615 start_codon:yes stop_codon:yes gene_type:complete